MHADTTVADEEVGCVVGDFKKPTHQLDREDWPRFYRLQIAHPNPRLGLLILHNEPWHSHSQTFVGMLTNLTSLFVHLQLTNVLQVSPTHLNISNLQGLYFGVIDDCRSEVSSELTEVETLLVSRDG